ncbi:MAG: hypothetical protein V1831_03210 [Candidatus Woesearchaeota archaeon]
MQEAKEIPLIVPLLGGVATVGFVGLVLYDLLSEKRKARHKEEIERLKLLEKTFQSIFPEAYGVKPDIVRGKLEGVKTSTNQYGWPLTELIISYDGGKDTVRYFGNIDEPSIKEAVGSNICLTHLLKSDSVYQTISTGTYATSCNVPRWQIQGLLEGLVKRA